MMYVDANNTGQLVADDASPAVAVWPNAYRIAYVNRSDGLLWELLAVSGPFFAGAGSVWRWGPDRQPRRLRAA